MGDTIFGLPNRVFSPISSPARRDYASVLMHVYRQHLSSNVLDSLDLRRTDLISFIAEAIGRLGPLPVELDTHNYRISEDPSLVYRNLVDAGWFIERTVGSETLVVIVRSVMELLRALDVIDRGSSVNFTGSLQTMEVALKSIGDDPRARAMMLAVSAQQAEDFAARMRAVSADIRANESFIVKQSGFGDMMAAFFDDFVAHLISDYKIMKSRYNPLRHAASIVNAADIYAEDDEIVGALAQGYVECGYADDAEGAAAAVRAHLETVAAVFSKAQAVVDDIDAVRLRVEERIARAVRFVDAAAAAETHDIVDVLRLLGAAGDEVETFGGIPESGFMIDDFPLGPGALALPRRPSQLVTSVDVEIAEHDPALAELARERVRYAEEMIPTPGAIEEYVERHLGDMPSMPLADFVVDSPREMLLLAAVRSVKAHPEKPLRDRYGVAFSGGYVNGVWSEYANGLVYRIGSVADPAVSEELNMGEAA